MRPDEIPDSVWEELLQARRLRQWSKLREWMLDHFRVVFETTRHPFDLWNAYGLCRALSCRCPTGCSWNSTPSTNDFFVLRGDGCSRTMRTAAMGTRIGRSRSRRSSGCRAIRRAAGRSLRAMEPPHRARFGLSVDRLRVPRKWE